MRVATFNLENLDEPPRAELPLQRRIDLLRPQLLRLDADIVCLQEVNGQHVKGGRERTLHALDILLEGTPYAAYERATTHGADAHSASAHGVADVHNLVVLSRFAITAQREIRHASVPPLAVRLITAVPAEDGPTRISFERPVLQVEVARPDGGTLHLFNVHLRAPLATAIPGQKDAPFVWTSVPGWAEGYLLSAWKRAAQALEVRLAVDRIFDADPDAAILVTGDFNAEDHETPLKIIAGAEEDTGNGDLAARSLVVLDRGVPEDRRFSLLHHGRPQMLDHVLASRVMLGELAGVEVHNETLGDELIAFGRTKHAAASFHAPLVAVFHAGGEGARA